MPRKSNKLVANSAPEAPRLPKPPNPVRKQKQREASAAHYRKHAEEIRQKRRIQMAEKRCDRAAIKAKRRRRDPVRPRTLAPAEVTAAQALGMMLERKAASQAVSSQAHTEGYVDGSEAVGRGHPQDSGGRRGLADQQCEDSHSRPGDEEDKALASALWSPKISAIDRDDVSDTDDDDDASDRPKIPAIDWDDVPDTDDDDDDASDRPATIENHEELCRNVSTPSADQYRPPLLVGRVRRGRLRLPTPMSNSPSPERYQKMPSLYDKLWAFIERPYGSVRREAEELTKCVEEHMMALGLRSSFKPRLKNLRRCVEEHMMMASSSEERVEERLKPHWENLRNVEERVEERRAD
ncbi:hypothetical protein B0H11DRAFT_1899132 [Mycena galericulata]|nr:hypothetical protein B0H11DRAFT_1929771 [Mycena galericulata]KAJ7511561.1 hypothetical protein B0H11DRAFT_1899132 [Mycena galericulata]